MARCSNCNGPLPAGSLICDYCGDRNDIDLKGIHYYTTHESDVLRTCPRCGIPLKTLDLRVNGRFLIDRTGAIVVTKTTDSALTAERGIEMQANGLPNTFVPGRNLLFLTLAGALAYRRGASVLVGGMCETDYSGYPDCRDNTLKALQVALSLGLAAPMTLETPLMFLTKAQTWTLAEDLGGAALVELLVEHSHTCYLGERGQRHPWGYGCGHCPACALRAAGHSAWLAGR